VYGYFELNKRLRREHGLRRLFLHAAQLELKHPASGQRLCVQSPLPAELEAVLASLGMG
jgi:23S rRNA pseudouridine955/2504/2580 synthase